LANIGLLHEGIYIKENNLIAMPANTPFIDAIDENGKTYQIKCFLGSPPSLGENEILEGVPLLEQLQSRMQAEIFVFILKGETLILDRENAIKWAFDRVKINKSSKGDFYKFRLMKHYRRIADTELLKQLGIL
jgi:hypothetical protein